MPGHNTEIIWYGRGGQGAFTAARLIGSAYALSGDDRFALAFPSFGPERRGAPVRAFTKLSSSPVNDRSQIISPDFSVYLDEGLFMGRSPPTGIAIVNSRTDFGLENVISFDASSLAEEVLGVPISNTAMAGFLARHIEGLTPESMGIGVDACMPPRLRAKNRAVIERAYSEAGQ
ncbi:MAG: 2-oxoacid:acceptor oxidoreductase family protein [Candidatus Methanomethylophilus sp.]|nr:2-oxoacid:acceptor oxidoreductase family protein [Methanomethylophilus sp.]